MFYVTCSIPGFLSLFLFDCTLPFVESFVPVEVDPLIFAPLEVDPPAVGGSVVTFSIIVR